MLSTSNCTASPHTTTQVRTGLADARIPNYVLEKWMQSTVSRFRAAKFSSAQLRSLTLETGLGEQLVKQIQASL